MKLSVFLFLVCLGVGNSVHAQNTPYSACGQTAPFSNWGPFSVGVRVKLGVHRVVGGAKNWSDGMDLFAGHVTRVVELAGIDDTGCLGVRVAIDGGEYFWRVRDAVVLDGGRIALPVRANDRRLEQCGTDPEYGPLAIGDVVRLKRHRAYQGEDDWAPDMDAFVGREAHVTGFAGVDESGCAGVRVDVDDGEWFWRVRDLNLDPIATAP